MNIRKQTRKYIKNSEKQLVLDFENSDELVVKIHIPKQSTINSAKSSTLKQRLIIRLCES